MSVVEIKKVYGDDTVATAVKNFKKIKELYEYVIEDFLETTLDSAREEMTPDEFTSLCLNICGFMSEYFT